MRLRFGFEEPLPPFTDGRGRLLMPCPWQRSRLHFSCLPPPVSQRKASLSRGDLQWTSPAVTPPASQLHVSQPDTLGLKGLIIAQGDRSLSAPRIILRFASVSEAPNSRLRLLRSLSESGRAAAPLNQSIGGGARRDCIYGTQPGVRHRMGHGVMSHNATRDPNQCLLTQGIPSDSWLYSAFRCTSSPRNHLRCRKRSHIKGAFVF
ncbi:hypothetical protein AAFF_G00150220 [Aldrovandia affinis]|uniref:Uncharacterized protein n=1 Tax=Aldrovandia affinis TaxID=143900 RepID=A0AAD7RNX2_9TELE|nr:hypothetical protein AAFF_G00150220 [Aldrovandia affinis]